MNQKSRVPEHFSHTELSPCPSRGRLPRIVYVVAIFAAIYLFTLSTPGIIAGIVVTLYAVNRLLSSRNLQGACPYCQKPQSSLRPKTRPFSCKTCGHKLALYGDKLADISSNSGNVPASQQKNQAEDIATNIEFIKRYRISQAVGSVVFIGVIVWWLSGAGEKVFSNHIADNLSQQYAIAQRQGSKMDMCVQAGATALSFLSAHDETNYAHWKAIEDADCRAAGMR